MGIFDGLFGTKSNKRFKCGPLSEPTKFRFKCSCGREVKLSIPCGYEEPFVEIECACGKGEVISVR